MCPRARRKRIAPATNTDGVDLFPMEIQGVPTTGPSGSGNRCRWGSGAMFALPVHNHVPQPGGCDRGPNLAKRSLQVNTRLWNIALMYRCLVWTLLGRTQCMTAGIIGVMDSLDIYEMIGEINDAIAALIATCWEDLAGFRDCSCSGEGVTLEARRSSGRHACLAERAHKHLLQTVKALPWPAAGSGSTIPVVPSLGPLRRAVVILDATESASGRKSAARRSRTPDELAIAVNRIALFAGAIH
jgi:hypothetical protein